MAFSTLLHWLISQSIFVVSVITDTDKNPSGIVTGRSDWISCGYALTPSMYFWAPKPSPFSLENSFHFITIHSKDILKKSCYYMLSILGPFLSRLILTLRLHSGCRLFTRILVDCIRHHYWARSSKVEHPNLSQQLQTHRHGMPSRTPSRGRGIQEVTMGTEDE